MKKTNALALLGLALFFGGCASKAPHQNVDKRGLASKGYECRFEESIGQSKGTFVFSPDDLKLSITFPGSAPETINLREDNFVTGGFTYVEDGAGKEKDWSLSKLEFIAFSPTPTVQLSFERTPSTAKKTVFQTCASL